MATLAEMIRRKLDDGRLPGGAARKTWAGYGQGQPCSVCEQTVLPAQVEYEFDHDGATYRFHAGCHGLWEAECRRRGHHPESPPAGSHPPAPQPPG
jgi:hypothetical protein